MKGKTCCVTGHRDLPQNEINKIKAALEHEIDAAVTDGFTCFMSGFADGVDAKCHLSPILAHILYVLRYCLFRVWHRLFQL